MNKIKSNFDGQTILVGMDIHKSSWNLGIHLDDMYLKNVHQKPNPHILASYLKQHYPGAHYKAVYEAGKFGFWIQRQLTALGIERLLVKKRSIFFRKNCSACFYATASPMITATANRKKSIN